MADGRVLAEERTPRSGHPAQFAPRLRKLARLADSQPVNTVQIAAHALDKRAEQDLVQCVIPCRPLSDPLLRLAWPESSRGV
jgi:hypothetical protein